VVAENRRGDESFRADLLGLRAQNNSISTMANLEQRRTPKTWLRGSARAFVGRDRELHFFEQFLLDAEDGLGSLVVLQGSAGMGKSTLLSAFCDKAAARGFQVGHGLIEAGARARMPWPWPRILRNLSGPECEELRGELVSAKPLGDAEDGYLGGSGLQSGRLALRLVDAVQAACVESPVLIVLDDVQRMDAASVESLRLVAEGIEQLPVLIVVAGRLEADAPGGTGADAMVEFASSASSHVLSLAGLSAAAVAEIVGPDLTVRFGGPEALHRLTAGNPMLASELGLCSDKDATTLLDGRTLAEAVALLVQSRVEGLAPELRGVLYALSLETEPVDVGMVVDVLECSIDQAEQWLRILLSEGLVQSASGESRGPFLLAHDLLREPLAESIEPGQRRRLHQRYAEALIRRESSGSILSTGSIAHHCCMAVPLVDSSRAARWALGAAVEAGQTAAWGAVAEWSGRGIEALDRGGESGDSGLRTDLMVERFGGLAGEDTLAFASLQDCRRALEKSGLHRDVTSLVRVVDAERGRTMDPRILGELLVMIEVCLANQTSGSVSGLLARKASLLHRISDPGARHECEELALEALVAAEQSTAAPEEQLQARAVFLLCNVFGRSPQERMGIARELLGLMGSKPDSDLLLVPSTTLVVDSLACGDVTAADHAIGQISRQVALNAEHPASWYPFHLNAMRCAMRGDAVGARRMLEAGLENTTPASYVSAALCALVLQAHLCEIVGLKVAGDGPALPGLEFPESPAGLVENTTLAREGSGAPVQDAIRTPWSDQVVSIAEQVRGARKVEELSVGGSVARVPVGAAPDMTNHWQAGLLKVLLQDSTDMAMAESMLEELVGLEFSQIPRDAQWLSSLCLLSESVAAVGHRRAAQMLYDLLQPFEERVAVASSAISCSGAVASYLAGLAHALGNTEAALQHCAQAVAINDAIGAKFFAARIRLEGAQMSFVGSGAGDPTQAGAWIAEAAQMIDELAMEGLRPLLVAVQEKSREFGGVEDAPASLPDAAPEPRPEPFPEPPASTQPQAVFRPRGDFWEISWSGETAQLRYQRGFDCIRVLLRHPERDVHCRELMTGQETSEENTVHQASLQSGEIALADDDGLEMIDQAALTAYRSRIEEARAELAEAESHHDLGRIERLREEIEAILAMVSGATGLGGRRRKTGSDVERARTAVRKRIKAALDRIRRDLPDLHAHLAANLRTGTVCSYVPADLPEWQTSDG
jgi:hypothetical protein